MLDLGQKLRARREAQGRRANEVAKACGLTPATIHALENGGSTWSSLQTYARCLGTRVDVRISRSVRDIDSIAARSGVSAPTVRKVLGFFLRTESNCDFLVSAAENTLHVCEANVRLS